MRQVGNEYMPEQWVILKIVSEEHGTVYKVFGSWRGGFADGDNWRLNSGITEVDEQDQYYDFSGYSGSVYRCYKVREGEDFMGPYNQGILDRFLKKENITVVKASEIEL